VTYTTFQELLLSPFHVHEILGFEILSSEKHFCHWEISEILLRVRGLDPWRGEGKENMMLGSLSNIHVLQAGQERRRRKNICRICDSWKKWTLPLVLCSSMFIYLSNCLSVCLSIYLSVYVFIYASMYGTICIGDGVDWSSPFDLFLCRRSKGADRWESWNFEGRRATFVTGWQRPAWCLIFEVIFHTRAQLLVATLQKETWHIWHAMRFCQYAEYIWVACWKLHLSQVLIISDLIIKRAKRKSMCSLKHMNRLRDALTTPLDKELLFRACLCPCVWQYVVVCCSALRCFAVCYSLWQDARVSYLPVLMCVAVGCSMWQCAAGCCSVLVFVMSNSLLWHEWMPCLDIAECQLFWGKVSQLPTSSVLQFAAVHWDTRISITLGTDASGAHSCVPVDCTTLHPSASNCNTLQHTAPHYNVYCNTLHHTSTEPTANCNMQQHTISCFPTPESYLLTVIQWYDVRSCNTMQRSVNTHTTLTSATIVH